MTTTQNTEEKFTVMNSWEDATMIDSEWMDDMDSDYKEIRGSSKRRDEWRDSKRMKQNERKQARNLKRMNEWEN